MTKTIFQINDQYIAYLKNNQETGMGYYFVNGNISNYKPGNCNSLYMIFGGNFLLPLYADPHYCIYDFVGDGGSGASAAGIPFPFDGNIATEPVGFSISKVYSRYELNFLPANYAPKSGVAQLVSSATLSNATTFYRYASLPFDPRLSGNVLAQGTYLTTSSDLGYANTGFAAVGRYALPMPFPASYVFEYELPAGASILVGISIPMFGQSGGGVEVKTVTPLTLTATVKPPTRIDDY